MKKKSIRHLLWKNPRMIEHLFPMKEWEKFSHEQDLPKATSDGLYQKIAEKIALEERAESEILPTWKPSAYKPVYGWCAIAASVLLLLSCIWVLQSLMFNHEAERQVVLVHRLLPAKKVFVNVSNYEVQLTLPDASKARLYPKASMAVPHDFNADRRDIELEGKAYFSVRKDASRPFSVQGGGLLTTVLGTSFTMDTRASHQTTEIRLHTGKVVVRSLMAGSAFQKVYLSKQGELLSFNTQLQMAKVQMLQVQPPAMRVSPSSMPIVRREGASLIMNNIPLSAAIDTLESIFNVRILASEAIVAHIKYTGRLDVEKDSLEDVLALICRINDLQYERRDEETYTINKRLKEANQQIENNNN